MAAFIVFSGIAAVVAAFAIAVWFDIDFENGWNQALRTLIGRVAGSAQPRAMNRGLFLRAKGSALLLVRAAELWEPKRRRMRVRARPGKLPIS